MRAKINLRVEIIDGEDAGYVLEETNRLINLDRTEWPAYDGTINPYKIQIEFVTPDLMRRYAQLHKERIYEDSESI